MKDNNLMAQASSPFGEGQFTSPLDGIFNNTLLVGLFFLAIIFIIIGAAFIIGIYKKDSVFTDAAWRMFHTVGNGLWFFLCSAIVLSLAFIFVFSGTGKDREWKEFADQHCQIIEKRDAQSTSGLGVSLKGQVGGFFGSTSPQTVYKCDDGITYTKNN